MANLQPAVIDRRFYVVVLVNPKSLVCVFSFCLTLAVSGCACPAIPTPYRNHDVSRGRHGAEQNLSPFPEGRAYVLAHVFESKPSFSCWPGCEVANLVPPNFYPCPESTGTPDAEYALTRLATSLGRLTPSTDRGIE